MTVLTQKRTPGRVRDLPSDFPVVPVTENEATLDASHEAQVFLYAFSSAIEAQDWSTFEDLFAAQCWWRDSLTLTFDKRTLRGRQVISDAWRTLTPLRRPHGFRLADSKTKMAPTVSSFVRLAPELATLDVPFTFQVDKPACECVGVAKLIPNDSGWKIWIIGTAVQSLVDHPFAQLPREGSSNDIVAAEQKGNSTPQGLPRIAEMLDAVVIGGSGSGIANTINLESAGANVVCLERGTSPAAAWGQRYRSVRLHHNNFMIQLPQFTVPTDIPSDYLSGAELVQYMSRAVETLKLPFFGGVEVLSNKFDKEKRLWDVSLRNVADGRCMTVQTRNLVISNGFLVPESKPLIPAGLDNPGDFHGPVQHTTQYTTAEPYKGKRVVVVGSGNSAHDVAKDLASCDDVKSVTILQRSPTVLFDFATFNSFLTQMYSGKVPVDTADFLGNVMPLGILRDMVRGGLAMLAQSSEELYRKLEAKGYMIDRAPELMDRAYEQRGKSFYFDAPGVFDLVLQDRIRIARGTAVGFQEKGLLVKDAETGAQRILEADGVVLATGYADTNLPQQWTESGFMDAASASQLEDMGVSAVDIEGEAIGQMTRSGRKSAVQGSNVALARADLLMATLEQIRSSTSQASDLLKRVKW